MKNINNSMGRLIVLVFWILVLTVLSTKAYAQDTICTYFTGKDVYEFDYQMDTVMTYDLQTTKYYEVKVGYRQVLCLDFSDHKSRVRKIIITWPDGTQAIENLDSKDNVYFTGIGPLIIQVGKPKLVLRL